MSSFENSLKEFFAHHDVLEKSQDDMYLKEFMTLKAQSQKYKENSTYPAEAGQQPCNKKKNRFKDILPFEYTRVTLHPIEGIEGSDYINANYITGPDDDVTYIAAQGPLPNTVSDFWRMLWYHSIEIVVMACREVEGGKQKCEHYWPDKNSTREFGAIAVTTIHEENKSNDFIVRDFMAECEGEQQYIRQYHYTAWPDHGKPESAEHIIMMLEMVHSYRKKTDVPLVFHCSAGCGRTGTMVAIDSARTMFLTKSLPDDKFSVHSLVEKMRKQRPSMVQAKDQYQFVYQAVSELARRALGFKPTVSAKPTPPNKPEVSNDVYENTSATRPVPPVPRAKPDINQSSESTTNGNGENSETTNVIAPARTRAKYENISSVSSKDYLVQDKPEGGVRSKNNSPNPSPPEVKRVPAKQRSSRNSEPTSDEKVEGVVYGNVQPTTADINAPSTPPAPRPKPRNKKVTNDDKDSKVAKSPFLNREASPHKPLPPTPRSRLVTDDDEVHNCYIAKSPFLNREASPHKPLPPTPKSKMVTDDDQVPNIAKSPFHNREASPHKPLPPTPKSKMVTDDDQVPNIAKSPFLNRKSHPKKPLPHTPKSLPTPPLTSTPKKPNHGLEEESPYSKVDMTQIRDIGPDIDVINETVGKKAPLDKVEKQLEMSVHQDVSKGSSIMDTILSLVGDDIIKEVDDEEERLPTPPPVGRRTQSMLDEVPPAIPLRTVNRLELVAEDPESMPLGQYDVVMGEQIQESSYDVVQDPNAASSVYEEPTPLSIALTPPSGNQRSSSSSLEFPNVQTTPLGAPASSSTASAIITMQRDNGGKSSNTKSTKNKLSKLFGGRGKSEKKRVSVDDISGPVISGPAGAQTQKMGGRLSTTVVRSPSDHGLSSSSTPSSSRTSPSHSTTSSGNANSRYTFAGDFGFGIRICKPIGPRQEPHGWKVPVLTNSVA